MCGGALIGGIRGRAWLALAQCGGGGRGVLDEERARSVEGIGELGVR